MQVIFDRQRLSVDDQENVTDILFMHGHPLHDFVRYFTVSTDQQEYRCKLFLKNHRLAGELHVFDQGVHVFTMFTTKHPRANELHLIKEGKIDHVVSMHHETTCRI